MKQGNEQSETGAGPNITATRELLAHTERLARAGGWKLNTETGDVRWTRGARRLHEVDTMYEPTLETSLSFYHPDDRDDVKQVIDRCIEDGTGYNIEARLVTDEGRIRWVRTTGERVEIGDTTYLLGAIDDITEAKRHEQQLIVLNRILRHNIRNDLNIIHGHSQLLHEELTSLTQALSKELGKESAFSDRLDDLIGRADTQQTDLEELNQVVEQLASFHPDEASESATIIQENAQKIISVAEKAREIDRGSASATAPTEVDVNPLLEEIKATFDEKFPQAEIVITGADLTVIADRQALVQALNELVENACVHSERDVPRVILGAEGRDSNRAVLSVKDTGPGIPDMERTVIEEGTETPLEHTSGIGLWFVNWLVTHQNGGLEIRDNEPRGSIVEVTLPTPAGGVTGQY